MFNQFSFISHLHFHFQIYSSRIYLKSTHPSKPVVAMASDDMTVALWDLR